MNEALIEVTHKGSVWVKDSAAPSNSARRLQPSQPDPSTPDKITGKPSLRIKEYFENSPAGGFNLVGRLSFNPRIIDGHLSGLQVLQSAGSTQLAWAEPQGRPTAWKIYRDGQQIGSTHSGFFVDTAPPARPAIYSVTGSFNLTHQELDQRSRQGPASPPLTTAFNYTASTRPFAAKRVKGRQSTAQTAEIDHPAIARSRRTYTSRFQWRAFIPFDFVPQPSICFPSIPGSRYDSGNHRYFTSDQSEHAFTNSKLAQDATFGVTPDRITLNTHPWVGPTHVYSQSLQYLGTRQAALVGDGPHSSTFDSISDGMTYSTGHTTNEAGNPVCAGAQDLGRIKIESQFDVSPHGEIGFYGRHTSAPSHEIAVGINGHPYSLYRFAARSFSGLTLGLRVETSGIVNIDDLRDAMTVSGSVITNRWNSVEQVLGTPLTEESCGLINEGCYQGFTRGMLYSSNRTPASWIRGAILDRWARLHYELSSLGYPTTDEFCGLRSQGCGQHFESNSSIYWSPEAGANFIQGEIRTKYSQMGWENGEAAYPTSDTFTLRGGRGQRFQGGLVLYSPPSGAHYVKGSILAEYARMNWENGRMGYPASDEIGTQEGVIQTFQNGRMRWIRATGEVIVE